MKRELLSKEQYESPVNQNRDKAIIGYIMPTSSITHKVIDLVYHEDEGNEVFVGTRQECEEWKSKQGFGYQIVPLTPAEIKFYNERKI